MHPKGVTITHWDFELCVQSYPPGRPFLQRMIELTRKVAKPHHHIKLSKGFFKDPLGGNSLFTFGMGPGFSSLLHG